MKSIIRGFSNVFSKNGLYWLAWYVVDGMRIGRMLSDKTFIKLQYQCATGKKLNIDDPKTFNEKLQWLKLHDHNPIYTQMVDKVEAKQYVANIIGEEYVIPTIAVYERIEDIEWVKLPKQFVIKCSHDSGGLVVCKNKDKLDVAEAIKILKKSFKRNFYYFSREWPYKNVKPRVLVEQYMTDMGGDTEGLDNEELTDYKFFCFNGEPKALFIASDRLDKTVDTKFDFFDMDFNHLPFRGGTPMQQNQLSAHSVLKK